MVTISSQRCDSLILSFIQNLDPWLGEYTLAHNPIIPSILNEVFGYIPDYKIYKNDKGEIIGFMNGVYVRGKYVSMPHFSYGGMASKHIDLIKNEESNFQTPFHVRSFHSSSSFYTDEKITAYLRLEGGEESIFPKLKYNIRRQIRIAEENNIIIKHGGRELLDDFLKVYRQNMMRLGSPPQPKMFFETLLGKWENGEAIIFCSYLNGKPVGGNFLLSFGSIIENCWAGTLYEYNKLFVPYLNYSEMIKYAISKGYKIFSFGRSSKNSGTLKFKSHWKPTILQLYYNQDKPINIDLRDMKSILWMYRKIIPEKLNTFIGGVISKYVY